MVPTLLGGSAFTHPTTLSLVSLVIWFLPSVLGSSCLVAWVAWLWRCRCLLTLAMVTSFMCFLLLSIVVAVAPPSPLLLEWWCFPSLSLWAVVLFFPRSFE